MKNIVTTITSLFLILSSLTCARAKEWRGIVPLHSTREDVNRLLGEPTQTSNDEIYLYDLGQEVAVIWFSTGVCKFGWGWNVPPGTVESLGVITKGKLKAQRLIANGKFEVRESGVGRSFYLNTKEGLLVEVQGGDVLSITYQSSAGDHENLRCPPSQEVGVPHPRILFDEYFGLNFEDEKPRLDNYALQLKDQPFMRGIIFSYGGKRGRVGEAKRRAENARNYLIKTHGIEAWRVTAVDGGYREESTVQLNIVTIGGWFVNQLDPYPTVTPSEVQIIKGDEVNRRRRRSKS